MAVYHNIYSSVMKYQFMTGMHTIQHKYELFTIHNKDILSVKHTSIERHYMHVLKQYLVI